MDKIIEIKNLTKSYKNIKATDNLSFDVYKNEILGLLGKSTTIINVVALGSSFLCGTFIPAELLPDSVLKFAKVLPTYWYVNTNDLVKSLEEINFFTTKQIINNSLVLILLSILFITLTNIASRLKQKVN